MTDEADRQRMIRARLEGLGEVEVRKRLRLRTLEPGLAKHAKLWLSEVDDTAAAKADKREDLTLQANQDAVVEMRRANCRATWALTFSGFAILASVGAAIIAWYDVFGKR